MSRVSSTSQPCSPGPGVVVYLAGEFVTRSVAVDRGTTVAFRPIRHYVNAAGNSDEG